MPPVGPCVAVVPGVVPPLLPAGDEIGTTPPVAADAPAVPHPNATRTTTIGNLEQPVAFLGRLSTDRFGERHARMLADDGVDLAATARTDDPTMLALAEVDRAGQAGYRFYAKGTAAPGLTTETALAMLPQ